MSTTLWLTNRWYTNIETLHLIPFKSSPLLGVLSENDLSFDISSFSPNRFKLYLFPIRLLGKFLTAKIYIKDYQMVQVFYDLQINLIPNQLNFDSCNRLKLHPYYHQFVNVHFRWDSLRVFYFARDTIEELDLQHLINL